MADTTPLLLLLDATLRQDEEQTNEAKRQIAALLSNTPWHGLSMIKSIDCEATSDGGNISGLVTVLLDKHPELASIASAQDGSLPLHFAASIGEMSIAAPILSKYPHAVKCPNFKGKTPLHYATREGQESVVDLLIAADPSVVSLGTGKQKLPIHYAAGEGHRSILLKLVAVDPDGAHAKTQKGKIPLHFASRWGHMDIVNDLIALHPEGVKTQDWDGLLPLHDATREGQMEATCRLVDAYPEGLKISCMRGELPVFAAVRKGCIDLVAEMIMAFPESGKIILSQLKEYDQVERWDPRIIELCLRGAIDTLGGYALSPSSCCCSTPCKQPNKRQYPNIKSDNSEDESTHNHSDNCTSHSKRRRLSDGTSDSSSTEEEEPSQSSFSHTSECWCTKNFHRCPHSFKELHAALECESSDPILDLTLGKRYSHQAFERDAKGMLPLHAAAAHARNPLVAQRVRQILALNPAAAKERDGMGHLPFHWALARQAPYDVVKVLLEANRAAAFEKCRTGDEFDNLYPLAMATACNCDLDVVFMLLVEDPGILVG